MEKPRKGNFILLKYDLFPYVTIHEITEVFKEYYKATFTFSRPDKYDDKIIHLKKKQGQTLEEELNKIRIEYKEAMNKTHDEYLKKLKNILKTNKVKRYRCFIK